MTRMLSEVALQELAREQYDRGDAAFPLVRARTALVLIDMQEEFVADAAGPHRVPEAARRVPAMVRLLVAFRAWNRPVIHTAFSATHHFLDRPAFGACMPIRGHAEGGDNGLTRSARFVRELQPADNEIVIHKPSYGAFFDTPLETILKRLRVDTIVLGGTLTDCCVGMTARQAFERGFAAIVASDATATVLPDVHEAELRVLRRSFARVLTVDGILRALASDDGTERQSMTPTGV